LVTKEVVKGDKVLLEVSGVNHSGYGVGRYQGLAVFIPETLPGDKVIAVITTRKKNYAEAKILGIIQPAASRLEPRCGHYNVCGGCRLQHADYEEQLRLKTTLVRDSLRRIGRLGGVTVKDILGMENPWHYRNKVHFQIERHNGGYSLGYYEEGTHVLTDIFNDDRNSGEQGCLLVDKDLNRLALTIINLLNKYGKDVPGERFFRHLMLRKAFFTGETMAVLVTSGGDWPPERDFARELKRLHPELTSLLRNIKRDMSGEIARLKFLKSKFGEMFDSILDRYGDYLIVIGMTFSWYSTTNHNAALLVGAAALTGMPMSMLFKEKYRNVFGQPFISEVNDGVMRYFAANRDVRLFIIMLGGIFALLPATLIFLAVITHLQTLYRLYRVHKLP
jgi:predicted RNA-binding protein with TRAM domain